MESRDGNTGTRFEDIPEHLIHRIQSLILPFKEAARTSILSKSWLHAWSTIPGLKFYEPVLLATEKERPKLLEVVYRTVYRYLRDNIPIESLDLYFNDTGVDYEQQQELASRAEYLIRAVAIKSCVKELSLVVYLKGRDGSFTLPDETLSCKSLNRLRVYSASDDSVWISSNPAAVIRCLSLRELDLRYVHISEGVLNNLFSTCTLLEKIELFTCKGFRILKLQNLGFLYHLHITSCSGNNLLEINHVPNLHVFTYSYLGYERIPLPFNVDSLGSLRELSLGCGTAIDDAFLEMFKTCKIFPFLESLTLYVENWSSESFDITCVTVKRLSLELRQDMPIHIKVYAPKLLFFHYKGQSRLTPRLLFPAVAPEQIKLDLSSTQYNDLLFHKLREALALSSTFEIELLLFFHDFKGRLTFDNLRVSMPPAMNVQQLSITSYCKEGMWKYSPFIDSLFSICRPKHVVVVRSQECFFFGKLMLRELLSHKWGPHLKKVEIKNPFDEKWETLTELWESFLEEWGPAINKWWKLEFKLDWWSP